MDVMKIAAAGMQRDLQKMEGISQNVANVLTPGYKRQIFTAQAFVQQVDQGLRLAEAAAGLKSIDASQGTLRQTGNPQDVAIEGDGYLEVATPDGPRYTRQGALRVDNAGRLVGAGNLPVMGLGGEIALAGGAFTIDAQGQVRQGDRIAGRLKVVRFADAGQLQPVGGGMYAQGAAGFAADGLEPRVRAGHQENSNVDSAREMVGLAETVRHFEALHRIAQGYDEVLGNTIRKLGEFN
ncbi:flagellar hook-basal body protein [Pseudoduganella namucuonensis]|uniref:Flagellar basal-body rod protein FlgG n=1 Tax=Pseudoduganella namucuonensis TaxID=1035707 RepID=A0A1I7M416_9BURK|nr:flagellar hook basal-body protein [Pseudoduganella namucuonensis]SFV16674.1 flagellar basal-body rod protein FlgG [Pseudoduganella namucuonensis]